MTNDIAVQLTCQRRALGLNISELADMLDIDKRVISFVERGERKPTQDYLESMQKIGTLYDILITYLNIDLKMCRLKGVAAALPYFVNFDDFERVTSNDNKTYWRVWQAVIGHLALKDIVTTIDDSKKINDCFDKSLLWLKKEWDLNNWLKEGV